MDRTGLSRHPIDEGSPDADPGTGSTSASSGQGPFRWGNMKDKTGEKAVVRVTSLESHMSEETEESYEAESTASDEEDPGLPVMLIIFVCMLAVMGGVAVVFIHDAVKYAGCPLGINMCNKFGGKQKYERFLLKLIQDTDLGVVPEWIMYTVSATVGATILMVAFSLLPTTIAAQLKGGGTVQALTAVASGQPIPIPAAVGRVLVSCVYLGSGGTLGMEGPCIQVSTALATLAGQSLGINTLQTMSLLASLGFSCGFAASFNAPLSGILFAMEELQHVVPHLSASIICVILVAAACSTATVRLLHGNVALFEVEWVPEVFTAAAGKGLHNVFGFQGWMLCAFPIGILCSFITYVLVMSVRHVHILLVKAYGRNLLSWHRAFVLHGLLTGLIGGLTFYLTGLRGVWGIGAESVQEALDRSDFAVPQYAAFAIGKLLALLVGISVRGPGDVLEPVLIAGAFVGGMCGKVMLLLGAGGPDAPESLIMKPCVVFGMTGLFASCFRFPLTPIVIVMELTGSDCYSLVLPTILTCFIANSTSNRLCPPLLHEMMRQDGIDLHELAERTLAESRGLGGLDTVMMNGPKKKDKPKKESPGRASKDDDDDDEEPAPVRRREAKLSTNTSLASYFSTGSVGRSLDRMSDQPRSIMKGSRQRGGNPRFRKGRMGTATSAGIGRFERSGDGFGSQASDGSDLQRLQSGDSFASPGGRRGSRSSSLLRGPPMDTETALRTSTPDEIFAELGRRLKGHGRTDGRGSHAGSQDLPSKDSYPQKADDPAEQNLESEIHLACSRFLQEDNCEE